MSCASQMKNGNCGGPWILNNNNKAVGITSARSSRNEAQYSPMFGRAFKYICKKLGGCPGVSVSAPAKKSIDDMICWNLGASLLELNATAPAEHPDIISI